MSDINHLLRPGHLAQLRKILDDPEATGNDRFVAYDLLKNASLLTQADVMTIAVGFVTAFFSALLVVKGLLSYLAGHTYRAFGWYRIILGVVVAAWLLMRG